MGRAIACCCVGSVKWVSFEGSSVFVGPLEGIEV